MICPNRKLKSNINFQYCDCEGRVVACDVTVCDEKIHVVNIYAPNKDSSNFFESMFKKCSERIDKLIVIGDYNLVLNPLLDRNEPSTNSNNYQSAQTLRQVMSDMLLQEVWRTQHPEEKRYSWYRTVKRTPNSEHKVQASRIDFAIISEGLADQVYDTFYINGLMTDHSAFVVTVQVNSTPRGPGFWKLNASLLYDPDYINVMNETFSKAKMAYANCNPSERWELIKKDIKKQSQQFSRKRASEANLVISQLSEKVVEMESDIGSLSSDQLDILLSTKDELEILQQEKTKAVMFRSKAQWYMEGERNSRYFYSLEKARYNAKTCNALFHEENIINDSQKILELQRQYYESLYTTDPAVRFQINNIDVIKIDEHSTASSQENFNMNELFVAIKNMKNNSCPGPDGIPAEFYKMFWKDVKQDLFAAILDVYERELLFCSSRTGVLNVIPKGNKDTRYLKNLRPLSLLNTDYKAIEKMLANRIVPQLEHVINSDQRGFLPGRKIAVNIRKILDIISETSDSGTDGVILNCDFVKCFDRIETEAVLKSLQLFGFSDVIVRWTRVIYTDFTLKVQNNGYFSRPLQVTRSVRQGGPASNAYFLVVAEILANLLREDNDVKGIFIHEILNLLNQFADDLNICSTFEEESVKKILRHIDTFGENTGFQLNYDKTTMYRVGSLKNSDAKIYTEKPLNWSNEPMNVLGVLVTDHPQQLVSINYQPVIAQMKNVLKSWSRRSLSLEGKVNIINTLIGSLFVYKMTVLPKIPEATVSMIEHEFEKFLWNNHKPKIPLSILQSAKEDSGLKLIDLRKRDIALKCGWIQTVLRGQYPAMCVYNSLHPQLRAHIWSCNLKPEHVDTCAHKDNVFWKDVWKAWCEYHYTDQETCTDMDQIFWCNSNVIVGGKPVWWPAQHSSGLLTISQLVNQDGYISENDAKELFGLTIMQYNTLKSAIPRWMRQNALQSKSLTDCRFVEYMRKEKPTSYVYSKLLRPCSKVGTREQKWKAELGIPFNISEHVGRIKTLTTVAKHRSFQYRLLLRAVITNVHLHRWKIKSSPACSLCDEHPETYQHLFYDCVKVQPIWDEVRRICDELFDEEISLTYRRVIESSVSDDPAGTISNYISLIAKNFIYKQKCLNHPLHPRVFRSEVFQARNIEKYYAVKYQNVAKFNIRWRVKRCEMSSEQAEIEMDQRLHQLELFRV